MGKIAEHFVKVTAKGGGTHGTVFQTEDGAEIRGVMSAVITMNPNDYVRMSLELMSAGVEIEGVATFSVAHTKTGEMKRVKRVEFEDGEILEY